MATWLQDLGPKERDILAQFRDNVSDVIKPHHDDWYLLRWLRARKFDLKKSEDMLRKSLQWREEYGADDLLKWTPPQVLLEYYPGGVYGVDKEGHPILYQLSKDFDPKGMMKSVRKADLVRFYMWRMEHMMKSCEEQSLKLNKKIMGTMHISDLEGFSIGMAFTPGITEAMKEVFAIYEANYPENLAKSFVINAPGVFSVIYNVLRPFLSEETKKKVHILGKGWKDKLQQYVDIDQLPEYWGGTATTRDGTDVYCQPHIVMAQKVPPSLYLMEQLHVDREKLSQVTVNKHSSHKLAYEIHQAGAVLTWLFATDEYDIGFGVSIFPLGTEDNGKSSGDEVVKSERVTSHLTPIDGRITCYVPGKYVLIFDNTYSWVNSKKLYYDVQVLPPATDDSLLQKHAQLLREAEETETTHL